MRVLVVQPVVAHLGHARRGLELRHRHALERRLHEVDPDRQRQAAARLACAQVAGRVVADPHRGHQRRLVAGEPGVHRVVGGARLAVQVGPLERGLRARRRTAARHLVEHGVHDEGVARVDGAVVLRGRRGVAFDQHLAGVVGDAGDEEGVDAPAAVGEHRKAGGHLHRRDRAGAQRHGQVGRVLVGIEAEVGDPVLRVARRDGLQHADRDHVARARQAALERHRALEAALVVLGLPGLAAGDAGVEEQRRVVDDGGGRKAFFQRRRVHEGLEARAGLAPGLRDVVELVLAVVEAAHQGLDGAVARIERHQRALDLGQLSHVPAVVVLAHHADHRAGADLHRRRRARRQARAGRAQAVAGDLDGVATGQHRFDLALAGLGDHGGRQIADVRVVGQRVADEGLALVGGLGQVDELFGAAVGLAALVVHDAAAQGVVGRLLVVGLDAGVDLQAAHVGLFAVLLEHHAAHHLGHVLGVHAVAAAAGADVQLLRLGLRRLLGGDEAVLDHAVDDVQLALLGAGEVGDRVGGGRELGNARQHRRLGDGHVLQRLAEIGLGGGGKAVGAVAQEDLVHVDLQDLVLGQLVLQLEREQHLVDLARVGLLRREVHVARHLHGDGGRALALFTPQVGQRGAQHAHVIDAVVLVKARIFDRQDRIFHHLRDLADRREGAPLLAELADELAFGGVHPQWQLGVVVGQARDVGQVRVGDGQGHQACQAGAQGQGHHGTAGPQQSLGKPGGPACAAGRARLGRMG